MSSSNHYVVKSLGPTNMCIDFLQLWEKPKGFEDLKENFYCNRKFNNNKTDMKGLPEDIQFSEQERMLENNVKWNSSGYSKS